MKKVYLVDYENVSEEGLKGFEGLDKQDEIYLFYSANNGRISLNFVKNLYALKDSAALHFMKAFTGKQALDIQLATFLGSLIEADKEGNCKFIIISKDKGFDHIRDFWNVYRPEVKICRQETISHGTSKPAEKTPETEKEAETLTEAAAEKTEKPKSTRRRSTSRSTRSQTKTQTAEKEQRQEKAEDQAVKEPQEEKQDTASLPAEEKVTEQAETVRESAEKAAEKPEQAPEAEQKTSLPAVKSGKTSLNAAVMQALSKEKYDYKIVGQAASLAVSFCGARYQKRETYKAMVRQFGQKEGLAIYNHIKGLL